MHDEFETWLKVLGLASGATRQAIAEAYRDLVKVWHPDRFGTDVRLRQKAQEKLKELNDAFEHLKDYRAPERPASARSQSSGGSEVRSEHDGSSSAAAQRDAVHQAPSRNARMGSMLIASAVLAGVGVWLLLLAGRGAATAPVEPATEPGASHPSPTSRVPKPSDLVPFEPPRETPAAGTGSLRIESQPAGALVSFDGRSMGETPVLVTDITPGEHRIGLDLERRGYKLWASPVVVASGHEEKLLAVLTPNASTR